MPYRQCKGVTKAGKRCRTGAQAGSDYCGNHQDQAHGNREAAMAASFREQSDETKRFVMSKVEEIEGACPTCGLTDYIVNGTCEPCAIFYTQTEQPQIEEENTMNKNCEKDIHFPVVSEEGGGMILCEFCGLTMEHALTVDQMLNIYGEIIGIAGELSNEMNAGAYGEPESEDYKEAQKDLFNLSYQIDIMDNMITERQKEDNVDPERAWEQEVQHMYENTIVEPLFVTVTGHRPQKIGGYNFNNPIRKRCREEFKRVLNKLQSENPDKEIVVITGGALGIDQDYAKVAYDNGFRFDVYVPFRGQELKWPEEAQARYRRMLSVANEVVYVDEREGKDMTYKQVSAAMQKRNIVMIDNGDVLVATWNGTEGGTANAVTYATGKKDIIFIDPTGTNKTSIRRKEEN